MGLDLISFFQEQGIDVFAEVRLDNLSDEDRASVVQFFPAAQSVIVFGREVPVLVYRMAPKEKTRGMLRIAEALDTTAARLASRLEKEQFPARSVPLYLPVRIAGGNVQGVVRLKHVAAAGGLGSQGKNTVLLNPRFGPRLLLSGVVTGRRARESGHTKSSTGEQKAPTCTGCGRCISVCPGGALGPHGVDVFRCRTVSTWVHPVLVPAVKWMLKRTLLLKCIAPLAPWIARTATIRCSLCVTECPNFSGDGC
ncbi:MAG: 4Fe-4S binding protein [Methanoregula sp.]|jgi:epoxyqueuosine reductase QueG